MSSSTFKFSFKKFNFSQQLTQNSLRFSNSRYFKIEILNKNNTQPLTISISPLFDITQPTSFNFKFDFEYNKISKTIENNQSFHKRNEKHDFPFEFIKISDIINKPFKLIGTITQIISENQTSLFLKQNSNSSVQDSPFSKPNSSSSLKASLNSKPN
jgi:hypothetical protein